MDKGGIMTPATNVVIISFCTVDIIFFLKNNIGEEERYAYCVQ